MSTNHRLLAKKHSPLRVHMEAEGVIDALADQLTCMTQNHMRSDLVIICIGTDRSTGDSLGPLIGSILAHQKLRHFIVYGTLEHPVHAVNLKDNLADIKRKHPRSFILAIDACLGRLSGVGKITLAEGPLHPGAAVQKKLPEVGDIHMTGIVNIGGMMDYFILQNTRLFTVVQMAETMAASIKKADEKLPEKESRPSFFRSLSLKSTSKEGDVS